MSLRSTSSRRSRNNRRASASAALFAPPEPRPDSEQDNFLSPQASATSRRHSTTQAVYGDVKHEGSTYDDLGYNYNTSGLRVKHESRSPSPDFLTTRRHSPSPVKREQKEDILTYASLPSSPISLTPVPSATTPPPDSFSSEYASPPQYEPFSLWDYLREELLATDFDSHQELKWERVSNFLSIPLAMEKILGFGFILCFDSFLHTFTILPIRCALAILRLLGNIVTGKSLPASQKADILRSALLVISILILIPLTDASKIYHSIRGQETIKLYVIYNALEIADRLFSSFGQDIIDCMFSRSTLLQLSRFTPFSSKTMSPFLYFFIATLYVVSHTLILVYELTSLNVAINSYDHALLSLLISNQFVEIKGSVFKKFEKDNLFQITCADIVERFTIALMLVAIGIRNLIELSGSEFDFSEGIVLPKSFGWFHEGRVLWTVLYPVLTVLFSEQVVDWLKHAFITKFNHIRPSVYERYMDVLCLDLSNGSAVGRKSARKHSYVDQSPIVARRLGFPVMPLAVLAALIGSQSINLVVSSSSPGVDLYEHIVDRAKWIVVGLIFWLCIVVVKIIIGVNLVSFANRRRAGMEAREKEDKVNDFGRDPIGEGREERRYNQDLKILLNHRINDATPLPDMGEKASNSINDKKRPKLEELTRFTMVKRIW